MKQIYLPLISLLRPILFLTIFAQSVSAKVWDDDLESFNVTIGTLEIAAAPAVGYIFRGNGKKIFYDDSTLALLASSKNPAESGAIPGLDKTGFRLSNGRILNLMEARVFAEKQNPPHHPITVIFEGYTGNQVEIKVKGKTKVCRVEIEGKIKSVTLWTVIDDRSPKSHAEDKH